MTFIKEPYGLSVKIRFDETSQFAEGSENVSEKCFCHIIPQWFAETSENWKTLRYPILSGKTDKSETTDHIMNH